MASSAIPLRRGCAPSPETTLSNRADPATELHRQMILGRVKVKQGIENERDVDESSEHGVELLKA